MWACTQRLANEITLGSQCVKQWQDIAIFCWNQNMTNACWHLNFIIQHISPLDIQVPLAVVPTIIAWNCSGLAWGLCSFNDSPEYNKILYNNLLSTYTAVQCITLFLPHWQEKGPHIYQTCPSANYFECRCMAIGARSQSARTYLEKHMNEFPDCKSPTCTRILNWKDPCNVMFRHQGIF